MKRTVWQGLAASGGKALGRVYRQRVRGREVDASLGHSADERERFYRALKEAKAELLALSEEAREAVGEAESEIFFIHTLFLEDEDFLNAADRALLATHTAEYALTVARDYGIAALLATGDGVMMARCDDLRDVTERVMRKLTNEDEADFGGEPFLYLADDITPSEVLSLMKTECVGIALTGGALQSHAAILAAAASLPMLVKVKGLAAEGGALGLLDADAGIFVQPPSEEDIGAFMRYREEQSEREKRLARFRDMRFSYPSGRALTVSANVGSLFECERALMLGAEGIGLFRSELLFIESEREPSEEEQFSVYRQLVESVSPHTAVLRVLDVGADKIPRWLSLDNEPNPALGLRGIRLFDKYAALFERQLRAMLRASAYGKLVILLPMVTSVDEIRRVKAVLQRLSGELSARGERVGAWRLGVMIETPAAALDCRALAEEVDYFSIGSNDLFQYTMAVDRENPQALAAVDARPQALFRLIDEVIAAAHEKGVTVSVCGALAGDPEVAEFLLDREIDALSLSLSAILPVKEICFKKLKSL